MLMGDLVITWVFIFTLLGLFLFQIETFSRLFLQEIILGNIFGICYFNPISHYISSFWIHGRDIFL